MERAIYKKQMGESKITLRAPARRKLIRREVRRPAEAIYIKVLHRGQNIMKIDLTAEYEAQLSNDLNGGQNTMKRPTCRISSLMTKLPNAGIEIPYQMPWQCRNINAEILYEVAKAGCWPSRA